MSKIVIRSLLDNGSIDIPLSSEVEGVLRKNDTFLKRIMSEIDYCVMLRDNLLEAFMDFSNNGAGQPNNFNRLNRYLMNWLNSFYAWIEFHERNFHELFSRLKVNYYDSSFEYRFAYAMRKYTTHQSVCISRITTDLVRDAVRFEIPINEILSEGKEFKRTFRDELQTRMEQNPTIEVAEFTRRFYFMIESFQKEIWDAILPDADLCVDYFQSIIREYLDRNIVAVRIIDGDNKMVNIGSTIDCYFKKKTMIEVPDTMKQYLI